MSTTFAFFYGTLLHPEVLRRVIGNTGDHLQVAPAILPDFTRHHVKGCDYPAIVPYQSAKSLFERELTQDERSVRGTVVSGLTAEDIRLLDIFEGDEYVRQIVSVSPLATLAPLLDYSVQTLIAPESSLPELKDFIQVQTYVWSDHLERLIPEVWSFDVFVREKLWRWVGKGGNHNSDYALVDERRAMDGHIKDSHTTMSGANQLPEFGHSLLSQFGFHKDYVNLNHGSYGSLPRAVSEAVEAISVEIESRPDLFLRRLYSGRLASVRERLAHFVGAATDEIVMVTNATHGINTVLRSLIWNSNDIIVGATTTYGSIQRTQQYIHDLSPHPEISTLRLVFPTTHAAILDDFKAYLQALPRKPNQKILVIIDSISCNPGCVLPWEQMVQICKEENVLSLIDAAHSIGQQVDLNLDRTGPDFWVSNCHKWLFAKRGCAVLYVPRRNQHLIQSTLPTSFAYVSPEDPKSPHTPEAPNFVAQFAYNGTIDPAPYLSVMAALDFRARLGGERRINEYCHALAIKGGKRLAQLLQTSAMPEELTANMTNVVLPLTIPPGFPAHKLLEMRPIMEKKLLEEWDCFAAVFVYEGKWWTRCSAQVWNQLSDFDHVAKALSAICAEMRREYYV